MNSALPLWVNLLFAGLYTLFFTGSYMIVEDLKKSQFNTRDHILANGISAILLAFKLRRIMALLIGVVFIVLYYFKAPINVLTAIVVGVIWLNMILLIGSTRNTMNEAESAVQNASNIATAQINTPQNRLTEQERLLIKKIEENSGLRNKMSEVMWLDEYILSEIQADPSRQISEINQAWQLCVEIAREIGLPENEGADWISYKATPIGKQLGITPTRPKLQVQ